MRNSWELCISIQEKVFRLVVCKYNKKVKKIEVAKAMQIEIPDNFGNPKDAGYVEAVAGLIRSKLKSNKITLKKYRLAISSRGIITRIVKLPKMDFKDLKSFMKLSIQQYFPIKSDDYYFDYRIQRINEKDEKAYYNLFLVAVPKTIIEVYANIFLKCGLKPKNITIYSDAVSKLFIQLVGKDVAVLDISYNYTEFMMLEGRSIFINSIINYALPKKQEDIEEDTYLRNLEIDQIGAEFLTIPETLKNYLNFFSSRHHGKTVEEIYFIGEGAMLKEIISTIEENLSIKIKTGQELLARRIITTGMPGWMKKQFYPERFLSCFGLLIGGVFK